MINSVVLVGRLTRDVEVRKTGSGVSVAQFTVACNRRFSRGENGQQEADFINCVAWRQTADFLSSYARKGNLVGVEGRIQTRSYDDKDGRRVYVTEVVADNVQLLESRQSREAYGNTTASQNTQSNYGNAPSYNDVPSNTSQKNTNSFDDLGSEDSFEVSSDDLPF